MYAASFMSPLTTRLCGFEGRLITPAVQNTSPANVRVKVLKKGLVRMASEFLKSNFGMYNGQMTSSALSPGACL